MVFCFFHHKMWKFVSQSWCVVRSLRFARWHCQIHCRRQSDQNLQWCSPHTQLYQLHLWVAVCNVFWMDLCFLYIDLSLANPVFWNFYVWVVWEAGGHFGCCTLPITPSSWQWWWAECSSGEMCVKGTMTGCKICKQNVRSWIANLELTLNLLLYVHLFSTGITVNMAKISNFLHHEAIKQILSQKMTEVDGTMIRWRRHSSVFQKDLLLENQFWRDLTFLFDLEVFLKLRIYFQSSNSKDLIFLFDLFKTCLCLETWSWVVIDPVFPSSTQSTRRKYLQGLSNWICKGTKISNCFHILKLIIS